MQIHTIKEVEYVTLEDVQKLIAEIDGRYQTLMDQYMSLRGTLQKMVDQLQEGNI